MCSEIEPWFLANEIFDTAVPCCPFPMVLFNFDLITLFN